MMIRSNAAAHAFVPNGLGAFQPKKKILIPMPTRGMRGACGPCGMGAMTEAEISAALIGGAGPTTEAWKARYGAGGSYQREASVIATYGDTNADKIADVKYDSDTEQWYSTNPSYNAGGSAVYVAPELYPSEACSPMDSACVARNDMVAQANQVLRDNANRLVFMANCMASGRGAVCDQYKQVAEPPVPALYGEYRRKLPAINNQAQIVGETVAQQKVNADAWAVQQKAMATQEAASAVANKPNQTVVPKPQPGEVATGGSGITAAELAAILAAQNNPGGGGEVAAPFSLVGADGKIMGLEPTTLALIAAGVGAFMLLKK